MGILSKDKKKDWGLNWGAADLGNAFNERVEEGIRENLQNGVDDTEEEEQVPAGAGVLRREEERPIKSWEEQHSPAEEWGNAARERVEETAREVEPEARRRAEEKAQYGTEAYRKGWSERQVSETPSEGKHSIQELNPNSGYSDSTEQLVDGIAHNSMKQLDDKLNWNLLEAKDKFERGEVTRGEIDKARREGWKQMTPSNVEEYIAEQLKEPMTMGSIYDNAVARGMTMEEYVDKVLLPAVENKVRDEFINRGMPKDVIQYLGSTVLHQSILGRLFTNIVNKAEGTSDERQAIQQEGLARYGEQLSQQWENGSPMEKALAGATKMGAMALPFVADAAPFRVLGVVSNTVGLGRLAQASMLEGNGFLRTAVRAGLREGGTFGLYEGLSGLLNDVAQEKPDYGQVLKNFGLNTLEGTLTGLFLGGIKAGLAKRHEGVAMRDKGFFGKTETALRAGEKFGATTAVFATADVLKQWAENPDEFQIENVQWGDVLTNAALTTMMIELSGARAAYKNAKAQQEAIKDIHFTEADKAAFRNAGIPIVRDGDAAKWVMQNAELYAGLPAEQQLWYRRAMGIVGNKALSVEQKNMLLKAAGMSGNVPVLPSYKVDDVKPFVVSDGKGGSQTQYRVDEFDGYGTLQKRTVFPTEEEARQYQVGAKNGETQRRLAFWQEQSQKIKAAEATQQAFAALYREGVDPGRLYEILGKKEEGLSAEERKIKEKYVSIRDASMDEAFTFYDMAERDIAGEYGIPEEVLRYTAENLSAEDADVVGDFVERLEQFARPEAQQEQMEERLAAIYVPEEELEQLKAEGRRLYEEGDVKAMHEQVLRLRAAYERAEGGKTADPQLMTYYLKQKAIYDAMLETHNSQHAEGYKEAETFAKEELMANEDGNVRVVRVGDRAYVVLNADMDRMIVAPVEVGADGSLDFANVDRGRALSMEAGGDVEQHGMDEVMRSMFPSIVAERDAIFGDTKPKVGQTVETVVDEEGNVMRETVTGTDGNTWALTNDKGEARAVTTEELTQMLREQEQRVDDERYFKEEVEQIKAKNRERTAAQAQEADMKAPEAPVAEEGAVPRDADGNADLNSMAEAGTSVANAIEALTEAFEGDTSRAQRVVAAKVRKLMEQGKTEEPMEDGDGDLNAMAARARERSAARAKLGREQNYWLNLLSEMTGRRPEVLAKGIDEPNNYRQPKEVMAEQLDKLANALGVKVVKTDNMYETMMADDSITDKPKTVEEGNEYNGYRRKDGTIVVNMNSRHAMAWTMGHETGHHIETTSPQLYERLKAAILDTIDPRYIARKLEGLQADKTYRQKSESQLLSEVANDGLGRIFADEKLFGELLQKLGVEEKKGLLDRMKQWVEQARKDGVMSTLRQTWDTLTGKAQEANPSLMDGEAGERLLSLAETAYREAMEQAKAQPEKPVEGGVENSKEDGVLDWHRREIKRYLKARRDINKGELAGTDGAWRNFRRGSITGENMGGLEWALNNAILKGRMPHAIISDKEDGGRRKVNSSEEFKEQTVQHLIALEDLKAEYLDMHFSPVLTDAARRVADSNVYAINYAKKYYEMALKGDADILKMEAPEFSKETTREEEEQRPIWLSNADVAVHNIKQEKATAEQWRAMIEKAGGLKAGEDKWMGLSVWLDSKKGEKLTKGEVLDYIRENTIQVEDVTYQEVTGDDIQSSAPMRKYNKEFQQRIEETGDEAEAFDQMVSDYGDDFASAFEYENGELVPVLDWNDELSGAAIYYLNIDENPINTTRLEYTTDGLKNKKEIALVVPTAEPYSPNDKIHFGDAGSGRAVAWARFGDTDGPNGERILVIDEIQSKRHQDAREKGVVDAETKAKANRFRELDSKLGMGFGLPDAEYEELQKLREQGIGRMYFDIRDAVTEAPFEKNWHELAMKRMLRYAAENGYDKLAWTTGEQQAERYNIGSRVRSIDAGIDQDGNRVMLIYQAEGGTIDITYDDEGNIKSINKIGQNALGEAKNIRDIVGKEIAVKALSIQGKGTENMKSWKGDGLRIGAEGMKGFYDEILPRFMNKYGKKWGVRVEDIELPNVEEAGRYMWAVDITPEMKESVMGGQPMFSKEGRKKENGAQLDLFRDYKPDAQRIKDMTDRQLLDMIDESVRSEWNFYQDEYDKRHNKEYQGELSSYTDMLEREETSLDDAYGMYGNVTRQYNVGGYATEERTKLRAQADALADYIYQKEAEEDGGVSFSKEERPEVLDALEKGKTIKVYRAIRVDEDGTLNSPMAGGGVGGHKKAGRIELYTPEFGVWEKADEHPELAIFNDGDQHGHIVIDKGEGNGTLEVAYNPYLHTSRQMLNDQFSSAWKRPNLQVMEVEVPVSELTSGYKADGAKNTVGESEWKEGPVSKQLPEGKKRMVILSRWDKPVRIVPVEVYAKAVKAQLEGTGVEGIPFNTVTPEQREALVKEGVKILAPETNNAGKASMKAYEEWKQRNSEVQGLEGYTSGEVLGYVRDEIEMLLNDADIDVEIKGMALNGSRMRGDARKDSDLDVVVEYDGKISEDGLFNILNENPIEIDGVRVDINPITKGKSGTLEQYMERSRKYDEEQGAVRFSKEEEQTRIDADKKFNAEKKPQIRTKNFKKWFGDWEKEPEKASKVVGENGEPLVLYHQTENDFTVFDPRHEGAGTRDYELPFGIFMKPTPRNIGVRGEKQMPLYANIRKPLRMENRQALGEWLKRNVSGYKEAVEQYNKIDEEYSKRFQEAEKADKKKNVENWDKWKAGEITEEQYQAAFANTEYDVLKEWQDAVKEPIAKAKALVDDYFRNSEYDGVWLYSDRGSFGRATETIIALNPNQVKSAVDNNGDYNPKNPDINFSKEVPAPRDGEDWKDYAQRVSRWTKYQKDGLSNGQIEDLESIRTAIAETDTNPSEAEKKSGNYKMGHAHLDGYQITIENPAGSVRRGTDPDGKAWETKMHYTYGYIRGTKGKDGDHIDIFLSENPTEGNVYVVDQVDPKTGKFDEHKVMYGFNSEEEAREAYLSNYEDGWQGLGDITGVSKENFRKWVGSSTRKTKPFKEYAGIERVEGKPESEEPQFSKEDTKGENFKRWFGDWEEEPEKASKVVGKNGEPLVVYHGTDADFNVFDRSKGRPTMDIQGMFFSPDKSDAEGYGSNVRAFYLNMRQPADAKTALVALKQFQGQENAGVKARELLIEQGFDGVDFDGEEYIAFYPEQIKSATENTGRFDGKNPDVRFSKEELQAREGKRDDEQSRVIFDAAKKLFGTTTDIREAGYVMPDGVMLDFSGRHQVDGDASSLRGRRAVDHRDIKNVAYERDGNTKTGIETNMPDFIQRGAIRIDSNGGAINLYVRPTDKQKAVLRNLIARNEGSVYVDFGDGWDSEHYAEYEGAKPARVLADIDRYFDEGIVPEGDVQFSKEDFSIKDEKTSENDLQIGEKFVSLHSERDREAVREQRSSMSPTAQWREGVGDVVMHTILPVIRKKYADLHAKAKAGDREAAAQLVEAVVKGDRVDALVERYPEAKVAVVHAEEATGKNAIPALYANEFVKRGLGYADIVQTNKPEHTGSDRLGRLLRRARFGGEVEPGREYILVDDHVTQGGTLRDLKDYIEGKGGKVVAVTTLSASAGGTKLQPTVEQIEQLKQKGITNEQLKEIGIADDIAGLTKGEARELIVLADAGGNRRSASEPSRNDGLGEGARGEAGSSEQGVDYSKEVDDFVNRHGGNDDEKARIASRINKINQIREKFGEESLLDDKKYVSLQSELEKPIHRFYEATAESIANEYIEDIYGSGNNVIDPDELRARAFGVVGYDGTNVQLYGKNDNLIAKVYQKALAKAIADGKPTVILLTGHAGAGKSTALRTSGIDTSEAGVVYDSAFNTDRSLARAIETAKGAGIKEGDIRVIAVYNDAVTSFANTLARARKEGRTVPFDYFFGHAFISNRAKLKNISELYPKVEIVCLDNSGNRQRGEVSLEEAKSWNYRVGEQEYLDALKLVEDEINREEGGLTEHQIASITRGLSGIEEMPDRARRVASRIELSVSRYRRRGSSEEVGRVLAPEENSTEGIPQPKEGESPLEYSQRVMAWQRERGKGEEPQFSKDAEAKIKKGKSAAWLHMYEQVKDKPHLLDVLLDLEPHTIEEVAAETLKGGGLLWDDVKDSDGKVIIKGAKSFMGYREGERRRFFGLWTSREQGGVGFEKMGEAIEVECQRLGIAYDENDPMAGVNAMQEVLSSCGGKEQLNQYLQYKAVLNVNATMKAEEEAELAALDEEYYAKYGMDKLTYEQIMDELSGEGERVKAKEQVDLLQRKVEEQNEKMNRMWTELKQARLDSEGQKIAAELSRQLQEAERQNKELQEELKGKRNTGKMLDNTRTAMERREAIRKQLIAYIREQMSAEWMSYTTKQDLGRLLSAVQNATTPEALEKAMRSVQYVSMSSMVRAQQQRLDRLIALKVQDVNGKNMSIAKNVDDRTRVILQGVRQRVMDNKMVNLLEQLDGLRRDRIWLNAGLRKMRQRDEAPEVIAEEEAKLQRNAERMANLEQQIEDIREQKPGTQESDIQDEISSLNEKMERAATGEVAWTTEDADMMTQLQLMQALVEPREYTVQEAKIGRELSQKIDNVKELVAQRNAATDEAVRHDLTDKIKAERAKIDGLQDARSEAQKARSEALSRVIELFQGVINGGKESLQAKVQAEAERRMMLIREAVRSVSGGKGVSDGQSREGQKQQQNATKQNVVVKTISAPLGSFDYMCQKIDTEGVQGKDGWIYRRFVSGDEGAMEANNTYLTGVQEQMDALNKKVGELFSTKRGLLGTDAWVKQAVEADEVVKNCGVTHRNDKVIGGRVSDSLSKGQATYIWAVWQMPDGQMKLRLQGYDEESIREIESFIGPKYIELAKWLSSEFFANARAKYNERYREMYNTSMARIDNYVPLRVNAMERRNESGLEDPSKGGKSLEVRAGSLINRKFNTVPVDVTNSIFDIVIRHVEQMENWYAYARLRRDLDAVLSCNYFRNQVNANAAGDLDRLYKAAEVATRSYVPENAEFDALTNFLNKGLIAGNIAYRLNTALKQLLSAPAYLGYSGDPRYLMTLGKNIATGALGLNLKWCYENISSFRKRVDVGDLGDNRWSEESNEKITQWLQRYASVGMLPNRLIDAITCSIGVKSIYDYNFAKATKGLADRNLTLEERARLVREAERRAKMEADIYYNQTQQSSHPVFLSPMQMERTTMARMWTVYQNSNLGYTRKMMEHAWDLWRHVDYKKFTSAYKRMYLQGGMSKEEAEHEAKMKYWRSLGGDFWGLALYGYGMKLLWNAGSKGLLGLLQDDDDDKKKAGESDEKFQKRRRWEKFNDVATWMFTPLQGTPMGNLALNIAAGTTSGVGGSVSSTLFADAASQMLREVSAADLDPMLTMAILGKYGAKVGGVDFQTLGNIYIGVEGLVKDGHPYDDKLIDIMYILNTPRRGRVEAARTLYKEYRPNATEEEFQKVVGYADGFMTRSSLVGEYVPGTKEASGDKYAKEYKQLSQEYQQMHGEQTEEESKEKASATATYRKYVLYDDLTEDADVESLHRRVIEAEKKRDELVKKTKDEYGDKAAKSEREMWNNDNEDITSLRTVYSSYNRQNAALKKQLTGDKRLDENMMKKIRELRRKFLVLAKDQTKLSDMAWEIEQNKKLDIGDEELWQE